MKKKLIILILFILLFSCCACEINDLNSNITSKLTTSDINQLIGVTYNDIEKIYGSPERSIYYINKNDLYNLNKNYITLRNFNYHSTLKSYYSTNNKNNYIVLLYKNNKVVHGLFNECDIIKDNIFFDKINDFDIKIDYFKHSSNFKSKLDLKNYKGYIGNSVSDFNKVYNLTCPKISVNLFNNKTLYFYNINENNNCLFMVSNKNNKITNLNIIDSSKICETILSYIKM